VRKGKSKAKNTRSFTEDSRTKKKSQGTKSSLDSSPIPDKSSFASSSAAPEVGKDGVKGKVSDFVKIFSKGASVGAGGESLGQSSRWRAKETPKTDIIHDGSNAKETVNIPDQQKKSTPDIPAMVLNQKIKILLAICSLVCDSLPVNIVAESGSETFTVNSEKRFRPGEHEL